MTASATPEVDKPGVFAIGGELKVTNFQTWLQQGERCIDAWEGDQLQIDCSGLTRANSLAVALLLALLRYADTQSKALQFAQVSLALRHIIEFSGLNRVLAVT